MPSQPFKLALLTAFVFSATAQPSLAADPSAKDALSDAISPVQKNIQYTQVDEKDIPDCKVENIKEDGWAGWVVTGPNGETLRRFADTNNDKSIDLWCYYLGGVEIYRDIDSDYNGKADQYRWLGTAGSRWGIDPDENGSIDSWKQISAEEVTQEVVAAIANKDSDQFGSLLLTESEAKALAISEELSEKLAQKLADARKGFDSLATKQESVKPETTWAHFVASQPGAIASSISKSGEDDLLVYENVVAMFETGETGGQLYVGTIIKVGSAWKLIDLPQIANNDEALAQNVGFFFSAPRAAAGLPAEGGQMNDQTQGLVNRLQTIEQQLASATSMSAKQKLHLDQANTLKSLISSSKNATETSMWIRQMTETVSAAVHSGEFPKGLEYLDLLRRSVRGKDAALAAYVEFEYINADNGLKLQKPDADFAKIQETKIRDLTDFVAEYPKAKESAKAMMDLALSKEFENQDKDAATWYKKVIDSFGDQPEAAKAEGALRRLDAIGRTIKLVGNTIDGRAFDLSRYRGRPVIVHYWATWCESCKQDMKLYKKLQAQYAKQNLMVVGVNVDTVKSDAAAYLKANSSTVRWPQLFAEGGLETSPLANVLGVQTLPTTLVIDKAGKVAKTNVIASELEDEINRIVR